MRHHLLIMAMTVFTVPSVWASGETERVSVNADGREAVFGNSAHPSISRDGTLVAFDSYSGDLVPGDTNGVTDVFVKNRSTGEIERASVATGGKQTDGDSGGGILSANGQYVLFDSIAKNLVPGKAGLGSDVFKHKRANRSTTPVSVGWNGQPAVSTYQVTIYGNDWICDPYCHYSEIIIDEQRPADSRGLAISGDGRFVLFRSNASNLLKNKAPQGEFYVRDTIDGITRPVSFVDMHGEDLSPAITEPVLSANGKFLAFTSPDSHLVENDTNGTNDVFRYEWAAKPRQPATLVSRTVHGESAVSDNKQELIDPETNALVWIYTQGANSHSPSISADGNKVAFVSDASNLVENDTNHTTDVFLSDVSADVPTVTRISADSEGNEALPANCFLLDEYSGSYIPFNNKEYLLHSIRYAAYSPQFYYQPDCPGSHSPAISGDAGSIAFLSDTFNLVPNDINGLTDVFVHEVAGHTTSLVSVATDGTQSEAWSGNPAINGDGRFVAFQSPSEMLVPDDTNRATDVFVHDGVPETDLISSVTASPSSVRKGKNVELNVVVKNRGGATASGVDAALIVPKALRIADTELADCSRTQTKSGIKLVCPLGDLQPTQQINLQATAKAVKTGNATVQVRIPPVTGEANAANNNSQAVVTVQ